MPETSSTTAQRTEAEFLALERDLESLVAQHGKDLELVNTAHRADALNLLHYLALRRHDVHRLQRHLTERGLSSLGRCESHVMASILSIHSMLCGQQLELPSEITGFQEGRAALDANTDGLFGPRPLQRVPRIMVTLDQQAADDYAFVRQLITSGMDIARINGAHDTPQAWDKMATNVKKAANELGVSCRIAMDLAGPKLRTGAIEDGPRVIRLRPRRDVRGRPIEPALFEFRDETARQSSAEVSRAKPVVPVSHSWLVRRSPGDEVTMMDARGARRSARVIEVSPGHDRLVVELWDTTYIESGLTVRCEGDVTTVGPLPPSTQYHLLVVGDSLSVVRSGRPSSPWQRGQSGVASIACSLGQIFGTVRVGERILFDDGKIGGVIETVEPDQFLVRITAAPTRGGKLRAEKGINLPDTNLQLPLITAADASLLELAARQSDMLSISFLRQAQDVDTVRAELARLGASDLGLILKIETQQGFANLPGILLHAMRSPAVGVMIARGDLAVEVGYARLAEVQEELLWLTEAAHLPVVWATEVLAHLAKTGRPSRAEITDAAMAQRAECVMLNKGAYISMAITELDDILRRMARHQRKTIPLLNPLHTWAEF